MKRTCKNRGLKLNKVMAVMAAIAMIFTIMPGYVAKAHSNDGAAFIGGMVAGHIVGGAIRRDKERTQAAEYQAYSQPRQAAPAPAAQPTAQQRLDQLNKLAAGGYISKEEYKAKKKAILDSM